MRRPAPLLFLWAVLVAGLSAIPVTGASAADPLFRSGVDLVPLDVCVRDPSGRLIPDLGADDFLILENGVPQSVSFMAAPEAVPLHAVLLIDISSSMYGEKLNHAIEAGAAFAAQLRSDDQLEVLAFHQRALPIHRFDEEPTGAAQTMGASVRSAVGIGSVARTALYDALLIASRWRSISVRLVGAQGRATTRSGYYAPRPVK